MILRRQGAASNQSPVSHPPRCWSARATVRPAKAETLTEPNGAHPVCLSNSMLDATSAHSTKPTSAVLNKER